MRKRAEVKIFNFSFVDILATTIGVLLFIMIMAILNASGVVARSEAVKTLNKNKNERIKLEKQIAALLKKYKDLNAKEINLAKTTKITDKDTSKAIQARILGEENKKTAGEIVQLKDKINELKTSLEFRDKNIANITNQTINYKKFSHRMFPQSRGGSKATPVHVECRQDGLIILGDNTKTLSSRIVCPLKDINKHTSDFYKLLKSVASKRYNRGADREVIVLWVKPDARVTCNKAIAAAKRTNTPIGWEPAAKDWQF